MDKRTAVTDRVTISHRMQQVIEHMLENPRGQYSTVDICEARGLLSGTVSPILLKMENAGWLTSHMGPRLGGKAARRWYRFTPGSAAMLRKAIR